MIFIAWLKSGPRYFFVITLFFIFCVDKITKMRYLYHEKSSIIDDESDTKLGDTREEVWQKKQKEIRICCDGLI